MSLLPSYSIKEIIELVKKGVKIEAKEKILELREAALQLQEENLQLKERIGKLEDRQEIKDSLIWDGSVYWLNKIKTQTSTKVPTVHNVTF